MDAAQCVAAHIWLITLGKLVISSHYKPSAATRLIPHSTVNAPETTPVFALSTCEDIIPKLIFEFTVTGSIRLWMKKHE